ncbi:MAG: transposase [Phycisphaerales bacterium]|nr:MAG: transposase [Phycisphaerales bacterium]
MSAETRMHVGLMVEQALSAPRRVVRNTYTRRLFGGPACSGRGTEEQWIKEDKYAVKRKRLSCRNFRGNEAQLRPFALAYKLGNFLRRLAVPQCVKHWSLTTLREKLIYIGARVVRNAEHVTFQMPEVAVPRELFVAILEWIRRFGVPPPLVQRG